MAPGSVASWGDDALALRGLGPSFLGRAQLLSSGLIGSREASGAGGVGVEAHGGGAEAGGTEMETWGGGTGAGAAGAVVAGAGTEATGAAVGASTAVGTIPRDTHGLACGAQRNP